MATCLKDLLRSLICPEKNWKTFLLYNWHAIIGSLHHNVTIEKIYDDTIILGASHPCWIQELYTLSPLLIKTINEKLDHPYIKQIRFKQTGIKKKTFHTIPKGIEKNTKNIKELTQKEEYSLTKITDPILKEALKSFRLKCYENEEMQ